MLKPARERTVEFGYVNEKEVVGTMARQVGQETITTDSIAEAVPKFKAMNEFTTFNSEYAISPGGDITIHFFLPPEFRTVNVYWTNRFPTALDRVARAYFAADAPRLRAKYTEELNSWWFHAQGYGHIIDLEKFLQGFFTQLDASLEASA